MTTYKITVMIESDKGSVTKRYSKEFSNTLSQVIVFDLLFAVEPDLVRLLGDIRYNTLKWTYPKWLGV